MKTIRLGSILIPALLGLGYSCADSVPLKPNGPPPAADIKVEPPRGEDERTLPLPPPPPPSPVFAEIALKDLSIDAETKAHFTFSKDIAIHTDEDAVVFAMPNGKTLRYDLKQGRWGSAKLSDDVLLYDTLYDFDAGSFLGSKEDILSFRIGEGKIETLNYPWKPEEIVSVGIGFLSIRREEAYEIVLKKDAAFVKVKPPLPPAKLKALQPCKAGCVAWGYDGQDYYLLLEDIGWIKQDIRLLNLPTTEAIAQLDLDVSYADGIASIGSGAVLSSSGALYIKDKAATGVTPIAWQTVQAIAEDFCVKCHTVEGFASPDKWSPFKSKIIARMKSTGSDRMPPSGSQQGQSMSSSDRDLLLSWVNTIKQTNPVVIGAPTPVTPGSDPLIAGTLKTLAEKSCTNCHNQDDNKVSWWTNNKADIIRRINSGDMPRGITLNAADRQALINALP